MVATKNIALPGGPVRGSSTGRPINAAMDLLGRRGALRVLWELREDRVLTFRALAAVSELPPGTLNARLKELREAGVVGAEDGYRLTATGVSLIAALMPLMAWSEDWAKGLASAARSGPPPAGAAG
ncbi:MAG: HxlR family transcriptional regulator [Caulobacter sp.]|nr:HxlR family transcriptional regulator [Caulobacter sp.]